MAELTVEIPAELEKSLHEFSLDWSEVARKAILDKAEKLKILKAFSSKFKLSNRDIKRLSDKINEAVADKFLKEVK